MVRLSDRQFAAIYSQVGKDTRGAIDNRYPCGGWIHYRVTDRERLDDLQKLLTAKCTAGIE